MTACRKPKSAFLLPSLFIWSCTAMFAQMSGSVPQSGSATVAVQAARKQIRALRIPRDVIKIDGILDEEVWELNEPVTEFWQREPNEGAPATERTEVVILYDDGALYVGARMYSKNPDRLNAGATRRDALGFSEAFKISLDAYRDRKTSYSFGVTAAGVRRDHYCPLDDETKGKDDGFDPVWEVRTSIDSLGWVAEMRIPFSQLRFYDQEVQVWGVNFNRYIPQRNEDLYWMLRSKKEPGWASLFGDLVGIEGIKSTMRLEIAPYGASSVAQSSLRDPNNPFVAKFMFNSRLGADLKMGLGPHLTLDAAVNPDFGQVEADPAVVNLTAFETIFTERRPFFVEGNKLLSNTYEGFFYSRRIGGPPKGAPSGTYVDKPTNSTILGAAKVSGRLSSGLSVGALAALTSREHARVFDAASSSTRTEEVEPLTGYGVLRIEQEFGAYVSSVGLTLTAVRRQFTTGSSLANVLARQAFSGASNWNLRYERGTYEFSGEAGFSHISGQPSAIALVQKSSAHYFQRPDAALARLDSGRTSLSGFSGRMAFDKKGGEHWLWGISLSARSPGFELNDIGRLSSADDIDLAANLHYRETVPTQDFHSYDFGVTAESGWNFERIRKYTTAALSGKITWKNFISTSAGIKYAARALSDYLTRGGPLMGTGWAWTFNGSVASAVISRTKWSVQGTYGFDEFGGSSYDLSCSLAPRPGDQWEFSMTPQYNYSVDPRQYVNSLPGGGAATYGRRYVFSTIERSTLSLQLRLTYNFTPDLSLEFYAEPFAASGRFFDFGELSAARSGDIRVYRTRGSTIVRRDGGSYLVADGDQSFALSNRDFNVRSFRSNVVVRWEWRLGSTLYFVWQQNRSLSQTYAGLVNAASLWESVTAKGDNVLALKVSYWLPVD